MSNPTIIILMYTLYTIVYNEDIDIVLVAVLL